jgi:hypothetical protein
MKFNSVSARMPVLSLLFATLAGLTAFAEDDSGVPRPLTSQISYWSVGELGEQNGDGWLLAWKATVSGDLNGEMRWWFPKTPPAPESKYSHGEFGYYLARWEYWVDDELILAGESAGKTVIHENQDGIWDGHGIVIEASGDLSSLKGRKTYETGTVIMPTDPTEQSTGEGMFVIY